MAGRHAIERPAAAPGWSSDEIAAARDLDLDVHGMRDLARFGWIGESPQTKAQQTKGQPSPPLRPMARPASSSRLWEIALRSRSQRGNSPAPRCRTAGAASEGWMGAAALL